MSLSRASAKRLRVPTAGADVISARHLREVAAGRAGELRTPVRERLSYLRHRLYAPVRVIIWFLLVFCALAFLGWPFSFIGFLSLVAVYLWVLWAAPP